MMRMVNCKSCVNYRACMNKRITLGIAEIVPDIVECSRYIRMAVIENRKALDGKRVSGQAKRTYDYR